MSLDRIRVPASRKWAPQLFAVAAMRSAIFGLGTAQLAVTSLVLAAIGFALGLTFAQALFIGLGLSLSSTAFALQVLEEKGEINTRHGRLAVSVLGTSVELWPRATLLGRAMDNDIVICDPRIAPRHLRFFRSWRGVTVQDLSGTRSVLLNGVRLGGVRFIQPGDCVGLGPFDVYVHALDET